MPYKNREQQLSAQRKNYRENKSRYKNNQYQRRLEKAKWFYELKTTLKCCKCGQNHPACLQFHHIDSSTKMGDVTDLVRSGYKKEIILAEIAKCVVLCANCHMIEHWNERHYNTCK
jgi:hypothetical protein